MSEHLLTTYPVPVANGRRGTCTCGATFGCCKDAAAITERFREHLWSVSEHKKHLVDSLKETSGALSLVTFLSTKNHPDTETVEVLMAILARARAAIERAERTTKDEQH